MATVHEPDLESWYEKDPKLKKEDVMVLKEWAKSQPHLPHVLEMQLISFLHSCYYDIEKAKQTIDNYFTAKTSMPEIFEDFDEELILEILKRSFSGPLPKRTQDDCVIFYMTLTDCPPEVYDYVNQTKVNVMLFGAYIKQFGCPEGLISIYDCKEFSFGHMLKIPMKLAKKLTDFSQKSMPLRLRETHFVNHNKFVEKLIAFLKPFIQKEIYDMIKFHSSVDDLYEYISRDLLPEEVGGELPSIRILQEEHKKILMENLDYARWHSSQKVDESKRPSKEQSGSYLGNFWHKLGF